MASTTDRGSERTVGEVVSEDYRRAAVFQRYGIDFCCGGRQTLRAACEGAGVEYETVTRALREADARDAASDGLSDPRSWELSALAEHIVREHHGYVRDTLPVLRQFTTKVAHVHGARHDELLEVRALVGELALELERHMEEEETVLFPQVAALTSPSDTADLPDTLRSLEDDHELAGAHMARIRELTGGFRPPTDACATYRATYAKLEEFEADLHRHVHLENNILFPRARAAAGATASA
jgi:regulator of cell morphogenesis and NO signaling